MPEDAPAPVGGLAVVIPIYNEGPGARACVEAILQELARIAGRTILLVVDDGSSDRPEDSLGDVLTPQSTEFELMKHPENRGYGSALRTGAERASVLGLEWVLFMDSDLTNPPEHISHFTRRMTPEIDYLKASRYGPESTVEGVALGRRIFSRFGNTVARALSGVPFSDTTNGFRAIRTEAFLRLPLREPGFPIIMEELYLAQRHRLRGANVPTTLRSRTEGQRASVFSYSLPVVFRYAKYPVYAALARVRGIFRARTPNERSTER